MKRLYRSNTNKVLAGVMGGFGEYANIDPVVIRAVYIILTVFSGVFPGLLTYFILMLVIPKHNGGVNHIHNEEVKKEDTGGNTTNENPN